MKHADVWSESRYLNQLLIWNVFFILVCVPTAGKMVDVAGIPLSISIFYFPFIYISSDVLTEVYGYAVARRVLWYTILAQLFATIIFQFVVYFPPSATFGGDAAFRTVFQTAPQFLIFGTLAMFIGDISNNFVLAKLKVLTGGKFQSGRFVVSTLVGQTVNTAIFFTFGLWGLLQTEFLIKSVLLASSAKVLVEILMLPVTVRVSNWLKKEENIDVYDSETDFNPLRI